MYPPAPDPITTPTASAIEFIDIIVPLISGACSSDRLSLAVYLIEEKMHAASTKVADNMGIPAFKYAIVNIPIRLVVTITSLLRPNRARAE